MVIGNQRINKSPKLVSKPFIRESKKKIAEVKAFM
jgi:hypothetical protein